MTTKQTTRQQYYYCFTDDGKGKEQRQVMCIDSTIKIKADKGFMMTKKELFILKLLRQIPKDCAMSVDALTNSWLKDCRKNGTFNSGDFVSASNIKKVIQFIYINDNRLFEFGKNAKGNYTVKEVTFIPNLTDLKVIKD